MQIPLIAIIGRPNVGKSALFNRLIGRRVAIVDEMEGVTRDRSYAEGCYDSKRFVLVDTGGIDRRSTDEFKDKISEQAYAALNEADAIIFVVDGKVSITDADREIAKELHRTRKKVFVAVNKVDHSVHESQLHAFYKLGFDNLLAVSALVSQGIDGLLEAVLAPFPAQEEEEASSRTKLAILGRPNVGKSSLINALLGSERQIVSPLPGVTRDAIDIPFTMNGHDYLLIDTAGIRRKKATKLVVEKFAAIRTQEALERADIILQVLDAKDGFTTEDRHIAGEVEEAGKGLIVLMNKWDLIQGFRMEHCREGLQKSFPYFAHLPLLFISAKTGRHLDQIFPEVEKISERLSTKITTSVLNKCLKEAMDKNSPPAVSGKRLRIYYLTQTKSAPPTFLLFTNKRSLMTKGYKKYLTHYLRDHLNLGGVPIVLECRGKGNVEEE